MSSNFKINTHVPSVPTYAPAPPTDGAPSAGAAAAKKPVSLFDASSMAEPTTVALTDGSTLTLPSFDENDAAKVQSLFGNIPEAKQAGINEASEKLGKALFEMLRDGQNQPSQLSMGDEEDGSAVQFTGGTRNPSAGGANVLSAAKQVDVAQSGQAVSGVPSVAKAATGVAPVQGADASASSTAAPTPTLAYTAKISQGTSAAASGNLTGVSQAAPSSSIAGATQAAAGAYTAAAGGDGSYDNQVMAVTYMGVTGMQNQMSAYAGDMADKLKQMSAVKADSTELSQAVSEWPAGVDTQSFTYHKQDANGNLVSVTENLTKDQASKAADTCSSLGDSMSSSSQLQQLQLQNMVQNYQNSISTMSNIMKASYDTVKNTLGNIRY